MMEQIAIFMSPYSVDIETEVNTFLSENKVKFIDIKYIYMIWIVNNILPYLFMRR